MRDPGDRLRAHALSAWTLAGGDKGLFDALYPVIAARLRAPRHGERFARAGTCRDCEIRAGAGYLTPGLDRRGLCPSCAASRRKYGPPSPDDHTDAA
jgi:hypothetical protein